MSHLQPPAGGGGGGGSVNSPGSSPSGHENPENEHPPRPPKPSASPSQSPMYFPQQMARGPSTNPPGQQQYLNPNQPMRQSQYPQPPPQQRMMQNPNQRSMQYPPSPMNQQQYPPMRGPPGSSTSVGVGGDPAAEAMAKPGDVQVEQDENYSCVESLTVCFWIMMMILFPCSFCCAFKSVQTYQRAVISRLGKIRKGSRGPGLFFVIPCVDEYRCLDIRTVTFDVPRQEILTKDAVSVAVDAVVYYRVFNPVAAIANIQNFDQATRFLAQTTLRNTLGTKSLAEILAEKEAISLAMQLSLDEATDPWGIKVERVEVKDVRLPPQLQRAMASEAEAQREAKAKVIGAEAEFQASKALKEASDIMSSNASIQLRYLQTLTNIGAFNSCIVFPLPMELLPKK